MLGLAKLFRKDPLKDLHRDYAVKVRAATEAQRAGRITLFASLSAQAEEIAKEIGRLETAD